MSLSRTLQYLFIAIIVTTVGFSLYQWNASRAAQKVLTDTSSARPDFEAPLLTDLSLSRGIGSATYSRADGADRRATVTDFEGLIRQVKNGEARFVGARRVENLLSRSEDFSNAAWTGGTVSANAATAPDGTLTADQLTITAAQADRRQVITRTINVGDTYVFSIWLRASTTSKVRLEIDRDGAGTFEGAASSTLTLTNAWQRYSLSYTFANAQTALRVMINQNTDDPTVIYAWGAQAEDASGQANQNPSEYVSTNVKTAVPYHGANVDGVKYFATQNGNTVASSVVTEATGATIPDATLKGYLAESARTNLVLQSEKLDDASWVKGDTTITADNVVSPDGKKNADLVTEGSGGSAALVQNLTVSAATNYTFTTYLKAGNHDWVRVAVFQTSVNTNQFRVWVNLTTGAIGTAYAGGTATYVRSSIESVGNGWYRVSVTGTLPGTDGTVATISASADNTGTRVSGGTRYVWGSQLEAKIFDSSYIPTTTASVTRASDSLAYPLAGNANDTDGSFSADVTLNWSGGASQNFFLDHSVATQRLAFWHWDGSTNMISVDRNGNNTVHNNTTQTTGTTLTRGLLLRLAAKYDSTALRLYMNGALVNSKLTPTLPYDALGTGNVLVGRVNNGDANYGAFAVIKNVRIWKKVMSDTFLNNLTAGKSGTIKQSTIKSPDKKGLVGYWSLDDGGGTLATDFSRSGNAGTLTGGPTWTTGKLGKALSFDGVNDYVSVGVNKVSPLLNGASAVTLAAWMNPSAHPSAGNRARVVSILRSETQTGAALSLYDNGQLEVAGRSATADAIQSAVVTAPALDQWHFVTGVIDVANATIYIYIDGTLVKTQGVTFSSTTYVNGVPSSVYDTIGDVSASGEYFTGSIDEVRIYNRALSTAEITKLYQMTATKMNTSQNTQSTNGLIGLWSFDGPDISGTTAYDRSGSGNNGTLTNGPVPTIGKFGQALSFDGVDDQVSVGAISAYDVDIGMAMSISTWVKAGTQAITSRFLWKSGSCIGWWFSLDTTHHIRLDFTSGNTGCTGYNGYTLTSPLGTYNDSIWHHVVGVIDRPNLIMRLYIDGVSVGTPVVIDNTYSSNTNPIFKIGTNHDNSTPFFGVIDEVRIYNRVLSASEIAALYNSGR